MPCPDERCLSVGCSPEPAHVLWLPWGWAALQPLGWWQGQRRVTLFPALEGPGFPLLLSILVPPMPVGGGGGRRAKWWAAAGD